VCSPFEPRCISGDFGSRKSGKAQSRRIEGLEVWGGAKEKQVLRLAQDDERIWLQVDI
jgi:hypothetical protein